MDKEKDLPDFALAGIAGLLAIGLYLVFLFLMEGLGHSLVGYRVPNFAHQVWLVFPGSFFFSWLILGLAGRSYWKAGLLGGLLAPLNSPLSVLLAILVWELKVRLGLDDPWKYGFDGLMGEWFHQLSFLLSHSIPVAVPCGILTGLFLAMMKNQQDSEE